jgi:hypothetical protein
MLGIGDRQKQRWNDYWFRPHAYVDLAMVRIIAVAAQLTILLTFYAVIDIASITGMLGYLQELGKLPDEMYRPITVLRIMVLPFGLDARPPTELVVVFYYLTVAAGVLALIGLMTRTSLMAFALGNIFLVSYAYSFGDFHHTEAPLFIAFVVLALAPSGHALSVDAVLRRRRGIQLEAEGPMAGWPLRLIQWMFVLIYLSAVLSKLVFVGGPEWLNGFTLQYYMIEDSLRKGTLLGLWFSQFHTLVLLSQYMVVTFQATFALAVIFPRLRWIYVPMGLGFHIGNIVLLNATFVEWIALYAVFIPWRRVFELVAGRRAPALASEGRAAA